MYLTPFRTATGCVGKACSEEVMVREQEKETANPEKIDQNAQKDKSTGSRILLTNTC